MNIPDYIIAGASKTGTEWIRLCLREHPEVYVPGRPSPDFFSKEYDKGYEWYISLYEGAGSGQVTCDKSTSYFTNEKAARRINTFNEHVGLVFVLRCPIKRAYSHYCMELKAGGVTKRIEKEMREKNTIVEEGFYYKNIKRFREKFDSSSIKIFIYEDLKENNEKFIKNFYDHIGVKETYKPSMIGRKQNHKKGFPRMPSLYRAITKINGKLRRKSRMYNYAFEQASKYGLNKPFHFLISTDNFPVMPASTKKRLKKLYEKDVEKIRAITGRELKSWL